MPLIASTIMGYSRNYQKYWDEKKRKRDEDISPNHSVLPFDHVMDGGSVDNRVDVTDTSSIQNNSEHHYDFCSGDESGRSLAVDPEEMSTSTSTAESSVASDSLSSDNSGSHEALKYFASKTYQKTSVPMNESCSFELMRLLDKAGSPRYLYNEVKALLNKQCKNGFQISEAMSREFLMKSLYNRFPCPAVQRCQVSGYDVYKFPFVGMLQDLLDNCGHDIHVIDKDNDCRLDFTTKSELWNSSWMTDTFQHRQIVCSCIL